MAARGWRRPPGRQATAGAWQPADHRTLPAHPARGRRDGAGSPLQDQEPGAASPEGPEPRLTAERAPVVMATSVYSRNKPGGRPTHTAAWTSLMASAVQMLA